MLGLQVIIDDAEGYAYLRAGRRGRRAGSATAGAATTLSFQVSLLLALLRRNFAELERQQQRGKAGPGPESRIVDLVRVSPPDHQQTRRGCWSDGLPRRTEVRRLRLLRAVRGSGDAWEVRRIVEAFVDAHGSRSSTNGFPSMPLSCPVTLSMILPAIDRE